MDKYFNLRIDKELHERAKRKCKERFGISLSALIKMFLTSFVSQKGVGFYIGDDDLCELFGRYLHRKQSEKGREGCAPLPGPKLRDIYDLNAPKRRQPFIF